MNQMTNAIDTCFAALRKQGKAALIPFVSAGDPDVKTSLKVCEVLIENGADLIEIGFPYSDPIADGPVIQASYTRALANKLKSTQIWDLAKAIGSLAVYEKRPVPLVAMASYSLILRQGVENFLNHAKEAGFSGFIVPDLPWDESKDLGKAIESRGLKLIQLVTPTTPLERAVNIAKASGGFLYCVSISGITGERKDLPPALIERLKALKCQSTTPLCVGFGISQPDQAGMLKGHCDGIIVGSALVRQFVRFTNEPAEKVLADIGSFCSSMRNALDN
ncbi:MAG: tryptophan synthase subunit alpha [Gemmataceae bacterium]|nr:tryptophan synthase subunit alpha [Gemmataceae bacterium]